jgi:ATP synthase protein I
MSEGESPPPLKDLDTRLRAARERQDADSGEQQPVLRSERGASVGYRVSVELFAGMLFGGGVGWLLDRELGTRPWLMVVLFLLGSAAGLLNSYRAMKRAERDEDVPPAKR